jgi:hypothetical protein
LRFKLTARRIAQVRAFYERAQLVPDLADQAREQIEWFRHVAKVPKSLPGLSRKQSLEERRQKLKQDLAIIHGLVVVRAQGKCEACQRPFHLAGPPHLDHWLGGRGRRREEQSAETCWLLCTPCDALRTANSPTAAFWNGRRREHCERNRLPFVAHIEKLQLPRRSA